MQWFNLANWPTLIWNGITAWFMFLPWYGHLAVLLVALALTYPYWYPIWNRLPWWAKAILGGVVIAIFANLRGKQVQAQLEAEKLKQRDARASTARDNTDKQVAQLDNDELERKANEWRDTTDDPPPPSAPKPPPVGSTRKRKPTPKKVVASRKRSS